MSFRWLDLNAQERGAWVRQNFPWCKYDKAGLGKLFNLSERGVEAILSGSDWHPKFEASRALGGRFAPARLPSERGRG